MNAIIVPVNNVRFYCLSFTNKQSALFYQAMFTSFICFLDTLYLKIPNLQPILFVTQDQKIAPVEKEEY